MRTVTFELLTYFYKCAILTSIHLYHTRLKGSSKMLRKPLYNLKQARERLGMSPRELGRVSGLSMTTINRIERGAGDHNIQIETASLLAKALQLQVDEIAWPKPLSTDGRPPRTGVQIDVRVRRQETLEALQVTITIHPEAVCRKCFTCCLLLGCVTCVRDPRELPEKGPSGGLFNSLYSLSLYACQTKTPVISRYFLFPLQGRCFLSLLQPFPQLVIGMCSRAWCKCFF